MKSSIEFTSTESNVTYLYDSLRKEFCVVHPLILYFYHMDEHNMLMKSEMEVPSTIEWNGTSFTMIGDNIHYFNKYLFLKKIGYFSTLNNAIHSIGKISPEIIKKTLDSINHIVFEVTDQCNLDCIYCGYGDMYFDHDKRNKSKISFDKVVETINYLLPQINNVKGHLYIGFYGGEPLLENKLIQKIIDYINSVVIGRDIIYTMTTNGVLINKNLELLLENDIQLLISLDGDRIHHGYRIFKNGKDSFDIVFNNAKLLKTNYPEYFNKKVNFMSVIHNRNTVKDAHDFIFNEFGKSPRVSPLDNAGINPAMIEQFNLMFNNFEAELNEKFNDDNFIKTRFINDPNVFSLSIFIYNWIAGLNNVYYEDILLKMHENREKVAGGACLPFQKKLFVTVNGKILPCERINQDFSLGYVSDKGVCMDLNEVCEKYNSYYDKIRSQCKVCYSAETCTQCFLQIDYFPTNKTCQAFTNKAAFAEILKRRISLLEKRPTLFQEILNDVILK